MHSRTSSNWHVGDLAARVVDLEVFRVGPRHARCVWRREARELAVVDGELRLVFERGQPFSYKGVVNLRGVSVFLPVYS